MFPSIYVRAAVVLVLVAAAAATLGRSPVDAQGTPSPVRSGTPPDDEVTFRILIVSSVEQAQQLASRVADGESFAALARTHSIDPSAEQGGLVGPVSRAQLRPELRDVLATLRPKEVSAAIRVPTGFALVQLAASAPAAAPTGIGAPEIAAFASTSAVKFTLSVDGFLEANAALESFDKPAGWYQNPALICELRKQSMSRSVTTLERLMSPEGDAVRSAQPTLDIVEAWYALGQLYAYQGVMDKAVNAYERARAIATRGVPDAVRQIDEAIGVAYLHKAEIDNGVLRRPRDLDPFPGTPTRPLPQTADVDKAIAHFRAYLRSEPSELEVKWLLNVAAMYRGTYQTALSETERIPASAFASSEDLGRFVDIAPAIGLESFSSAGGVIVDDFDGDGRVDVMTSNFDSCGALQLFHQEADGRFTDVSAKAGLGGQLGGLNLAQADYNNDGCLDALLMRGGWEVAQRRTLLRNNCDGTFTDVTEAAGLARPATSSQTAVWTDIDNDGFVDLFVGNEDAPAQLFRNKGDGTFEDIARSAGVDRVAYTKGVTAGDYDNDGYPDLYVSNIGGANFLYHNNHDRTFTERAHDAGVPGGGSGFATWFFDYDNDGWPDIFASTYYLSVDESVRSYLHMPQNGSTEKLYRNNHDGTFTDVTRLVGLDKVYMPMGANFGDIDNDGFLDIYLGTGSPSYAAIVPSVLLHNKAGRTFVDITASSGTGDIHKGHGVAFADIDNDGNEDIVFKVGGATPGDAHAFRVYRNPAHGNDWLSLHLIGVKTNRGALGARITVTTTSGDTTRAIHRTVTSGGSFGASPLQQHVGLGPRAARVDVDVWWPASNTRQHFADVAKNQTIEIREFAGDYARVIRPSTSPK